ncbi:TPA: CPBP family intramembrane metalloprotease, partial [Listeria monocytogenes]|nr:CPBP family intramembrane metalloprotease [Listeria monocytogenes]
NFVQTIALGFVLQLTIQIIFITVMVNLNITNSNNEFLLEKLTSNWLAYGTLIVLISPVVEEYINRYILFLLPLKILRKSIPYFQRNWGVFFIAMISSLIFAVFHGEQFLWPYLAMGLIYCWVSYQSNFWGSILLHISNNLLFFVLNMI